MIRAPKGFRAHPRGCHGKIVSYAKGAMGGRWGCCQIWFMPCDRKCTDIFLSGANSVLWHILLLKFGPAATPPNFQNRWSLLFNCRFETELIFCMKNLSILPFFGWFNRHFVNVIITALSNGITKIFSQFICGYSVWEYNPRGCVVVCEIQKGAVFIFTDTKFDWCELNWTRITMQLSVMPSVTTLFKIRNCKPFYIKISI